MAQVILIVSEVDHSIIVLLSPEPTFLIVPEFTLEVTSIAILYDSSSMS